MFNNMSSTLGGVENGLSFLERIIDIIRRLFAALLGTSAAETTTAAEVTSAAATE